MATRQLSVKAVRPACSVFYRAGYPDDPHGADGELSTEGSYQTWLTATSMPRGASRRSGSNLDLFPEEPENLPGWQWILDVAPHVAQA
ncbi:hypothetical protein [Paraburkholderia domus]|uniref:hypothetical protein n=1 Tax=Paraburkholderia domus TaxID=2793075 RepID=UPI001914664B|nr:hypothetical protein [Paraburkholderia domus]MBK5065771.1 hypothetical protein [Burkholderia sp. R-70199]